MFFLEMNALWQLILNLKLRWASINQIDFFRRIEIDHCALTIVFKFEIAML